MDITRKNELYSLFDHVDERERKLITPLLDEALVLEDRMHELRKLPFIKVHPNDPAIQRNTPAAKQYKECMQSYMNLIRILLNILRKVESSAADELMERLKEFSLSDE